MKLLVVASADNGYEISVRDQMNTGTVITIRTEVYLDPEETKTRMIDLLETVIKNDIKKPFKPLKGEISGGSTSIPAVDR